MKAAHQQHEYKMSVRARKAYATSVQDLPHHRISLFLSIPSESQRRSIQQKQQLKPWLAVLQSRRSNALIKNPGNLANSYTYVNIFSYPLSSPTSTSLSIKSPPERGESRKEGERTLIWLCNTVQFAIGQ